MLSVVIVNWNSGPLLGGCLRSLRDNAPGCEIIVVDNASADASLEAAARMQPFVRTIPNARNLGFAAACNQGWRASGGRRILFLNPDTECFPGSVRCLEETLDAGGGIWAAGGCLVGPDGRPQADFNVRPFPTVARVAAEALLLDELGRALRRLRALPAAAPEGAVDVDQPAAACLLVSRGALEAVGGFDESFRPAWFEDVDLCRRIRLAGGRIRYQPGARFLHHGGYSLDRMPGEDFLMHFHTNQIRYFRKHLGRRAAGSVRALVLAGLGLRAAVSLLYPLARGASRAQSAAVFLKAFGRIALSAEGRK